MKVNVVASQLQCSENQIQLCSFDQTDVSSCLQCFARSVQTELSLFHVVCRSQQHCFNCGPSLIYGGFTVSYLYFICLVCVMCCATNGVALLLTQSNVRKLCCWLHIYWEKERGGQLHILFIMLSKSNKIVILFSSRVQSCLFI